MCRIAGPKQWIMLTFFACSLEHHIPSLSLNLLCETDNNIQAEVCPRSGFSSMHALPFGNDVNSKMYPKC